MEKDQQIIYGTLGFRVKAIVLDSVVLMILGVIIALTLNQFDNVPNTLRAALFVFVFCLYDPLFTSLFGGTLGHLTNGLRVRKDKNTNERIGFLPALVRFIIKVALGWISLLTVTGNEKNKSIHDSVVGSVVIKVE